MGVGLKESPGQKVEVVWGMSREWVIPKGIEEHNVGRKAEEHYVGRKAMGMEVQGRRRRGRPKIVEQWDDISQSVYTTPTNPDQRFEPD